MKGPLALCLAVLLLAGCRSPGQPNDPFFGRATVEPPRTGVAAGSRPAPYYSGAPAAMPRAPLVTVPNTTAPAQGRYQPRQTPAPLYGAGSQSLVSSPTTTQPRLLPGSTATPLATPRVGMPSASPAPVATPPASTPPAAAAPAPVAPPATAAPALAPVPSQPAFSAPPVGPTLRPAASIPAVPLQSQWSPAQNPCANLAGRARIVRPLVPRPGWNRCPPGTVPVPCVPTPVPCVPSYGWRPPGAAASAGPINIADLPEPRPAARSK